MIYDIAFELTFDKDAKPAVIAALSEFCCNVDGDNFDPALITDNCQISFIIKNQPEFADYYHFFRPSSRLLGKISVGVIYLYIGELTDKIVFRFWPATKRMGQMCMLSTDLRDQFINLINEYEGYDLMLDYGDGHLECLHSNPDAY